MALGGLVIKNQAVECASSVATSFVTGEGDGLLGLAFGNINAIKPTPQPTPVQMMSTEGVIPKVSIYISVVQSHLTKTIRGPNCLHANSPASAKNLAFIPSVQLHVR